MKGANEEGRLRVSTRRRGAGDEDDAVTGKRCGLENGGASRVRTRMMRPEVPRGQGRRRGASNEERKEKRKAWDAHERLRNHAQIDDDTFEAS